MSRDEEVEGAGAHAEQSRGEVGVRSPTTVPHSLCMGRLQRGHRWAPSDGLPHSPHGAVCGSVLAAAHRGTLACLGPWEVLAGSCAWWGVTAAHRGCSHGVLRSTLSSTASGRASPPCVFTTATMERGFTALRSRMCCRSFESERTPDSVRLRMLAGVWWSSMSVACATILVLALREMPRGAS